MLAKKPQLLIFIIFIILETATGNPVRGVWMTISGTQDPFTREGITEVVITCKKTGIKNIYFSVWDQSMVNFYPDSDLFRKYPFLEVNPKFIFDPLQTLIQLAKPYSIGIYAWFQYGFATTYSDSTGGPILISKPEWKSLDFNHQITTKNNFQWMNGFHPEVQTFMTDLILSVIKKYEVAGIQGDDRLPAMPSNAGYDQYTVSQYKSDHSGKQPPLDEKDEEWVTWRCNILNKFMNNLYLAIKRANFKMQVQMAPSVFPWSKYQYLQDWPTWVTQNSLDVVVPQIYRYNISAYSTTISNNLNLIDGSKRNKFYAGILIGVGSNTTVNAVNLKDEILINKALNLSGEVYFYHESLKSPQVQQVLIETGVEYERGSFHNQQ